MKNIVVFTGAGMSAESGLKTFRDADGLWENHAIEDVATPEAFDANPELVLRFYNERRKQLLECSPNDAHIAI
ncbi:MAG: Sir2 family NAD-dependent protein deacetylase, partial [Bacteroidota bacterium]